MKVLFVCLEEMYSNSSAMIGNIGIVKALIESGNSVEMIMLPKNSKSNPSENIVEILDKAKVIFVGKNSVYNNILGRKSKYQDIKIRVLRFLWHKFFVYDHTFSAAKTIDIQLLSSNSYDVVISVSDPKTAHLCVKTLKKKGLQYGKWIQIWGDPLALDIANTTVYPPMILSFIERKLIKLADKIVYVSPFTLEAQQTYYQQYKNKMQFVPLPYISETIYDEPRNSVFIIGYYGAYKSSIRNIIPFYESCKELGNIVDVAIYGNSDLNLEDYDNIHIFGRGNIDEHMKNANLVVCILNKKGDQVPAKINYLCGTNKPILLIVDGERQTDMKNYFAKYDRFYICRNNKQEISNTIKTIMKEKRSFTPCSNFNGQTVLRQILEE